MGYYLLFVYAMAIDMVLSSPTLTYVASYIVSLFLVYDPLM